MKSIINAVVVGIRFQARITAAAAKTVGELKAPALLLLEELKTAIKESELATVATEYTQAQEELASASIDLTKTWKKAAREFEKTVKAHFKGTNGVVDVSDKSTTNQAEA
jgi:hypothetical protein